MPVEVLKVRIDTLKKGEVLNKISDFLSSNEAHTVFTPNPEMLVDSVRDKYFREVLNSSSLNICDGKGIQLVAKEKIERIPGVDLMLEICRLAEAKNKTVYFLGSGDTEVLKKLIENIQKQFPNLKIVGYDPGPTITMKQFNNKTIIQADEAKNDRVINDIIQKSPDILFVAFGHNKQEKWIYENLKHLPSVKAAMGVGGAFDFISGHAVRAPKWLRKAGFEWLWRLIRQPSRFGRIMKATVIFLYFVFLRKRRVHCHPE